MDIKSEDFQIKGVLDEQTNNEQEKKITLQVEEEMNEIKMENKSYNNTNDMRLFQKLKIEYDQILTRKRFFLLYILLLVFYISLNLGLISGKNKINKIFS
jgi:uncharacterized membrane protein